MFWGSFIGTRKGPFLFWDSRNWGKLTSQSYCEHIVPLIQRAKEENPALLLMQDGAPCHAARNTMEVLQRAGIDPIVWPPFSPDLNPIGSLWNTVKDFVQNRYPEIQMGSQISLQNLQGAILEAWESITLEDLPQLMESMPARCQAVIDAERGYTRF